MKKVMLVFSTGSEALKICPLVNELKVRDSMQVTVCMINQPSQAMVQIVDAFSIRPNYVLYMEHEAHALFDITTNILCSFKGVLKETAPDIVLLSGDSAVSFSVALACQYMEIPIGYVDAESVDSCGCSQEEFNQRGISMIAACHFTPTETSKRNLVKQGKSANRIYVTGSTEVDAFRMIACVNYAHFELEWAEGSRLVLLVLQRLEELDHLLGMLQHVMDEAADTKALCFIEKSMCEVKTAYQGREDDSRIHVIKSFTISDFYNFLVRSSLVLTDGAAAQKAIFFSGNPVFVIPKQSDLKRIAKTEEDAICRQILRLLKDEEYYHKITSLANPYGDGYARKRIADILEIGEIKAI